MVDKDTSPTNTTSTGTSTHGFPPLGGVRVYPQHVKRIAQTVRLRASSIEEYKKCHAAVWPEVLRQIHDCGIRDYAIHILPTKGGDLYLFATFKYIGTDWAESCKLMAANPKVREWWAMTDGMQESDVPGAVGSAEGPGWWTGVEEVFYTDGES